MAALRRTLLRYDLELPTTELERLFLPIARRAGSAAGLVPLRFTHYQVKYEPQYVETVLKRVAARLSGILNT